MSTAKFSKIKVVVMGDGGVGKTTWVRRNLTGTFQRQYIPTMGVEVHPVSFNNVICNCWDTAGQEKYAGLEEGYYIGAQGIIIMFDVTNRNSFKNVNMWLKRARKVVPDTHIVICGNKVDCKEAKVLAIDVKRWKELHSDIMYYNLSVKSNHNFEKPFLHLIKANKLSIEDTGPTELQKLFKTDLSDEEIRLNIELFNSREE